MLGKNLKYYRLKNNMTKKALADAIGMTPMAITNYENGNRQPNMDTIKALAKVLNISVTDFLANTGGKLQVLTVSLEKELSLELRIKSILKNL